MNRKVYIASPYTLGDAAQNVRRQIDVANDLMNRGHVPFTPLLSHFHHLVHWRPHEDWIKYDLAWIESCDILVRLPGESKGADMEVEHATKMGIPTLWVDSDWATGELVDDFIEKMNEARLANESI